MYIGLVVYAIYGSICLIGLLFCFSANIFNTIDENLNFEIAARQKSNPLNITVFSLDEWMKQNHRVVGLLLAFLSLIDLKLYLSIIDVLF